MNQPKNIKKIPMIAMHHKMYGVTPKYTIFSRMLAKKKGRRKLSRSISSSSLITHIIRTK
jgi:hypothetical protein